MRKVIDVPADVRRWVSRPPDVEDARADLQRAMGKLVFAHSARLARSGKDPAPAPALAIVDVFEAVCAAAEVVGWELVEDLHSSWWSCDDDADVMLQRAVRGFDEACSRDGASLALVFRGRAVRFRAAAAERKTA